MPPHRPAPPPAPALRTAGRRPWLDDPELAAHPPAARSGVDAAAIAAAEAGELGPLVRGLVAELEAQAAELTRVQALSEEVGRFHRQLSRERESRQRAQVRLKTLLSALHGLDDTLAIVHRERDEARAEVAMLRQELSGFDDVGPIRAWRMARTRRRVGP